MEEGNRGGKGRREEATEDEAVRLSTTGQVHRVKRKGNTASRGVSDFQPISSQKKGKWEIHKKLLFVRAAESGAKRQPRGITKPKPVSPALQAVVGVKEIARTQALKRIWDYIKENNLQDPENKKIIVCDEKLKGIFAGKDRVGFLEISGLLNPHFEK
ncbi:upstream activation factor subunit spp27-like [Asparagus officinalis]|uniref:upstream activation factor subunit spp27-like n=1 Tax=Asparagus officinalis TaxID=4686 RepID=UPI00098E4E1A|nr:upstream activation factor subunit spp27-like [Asparagus officinalis]